MNPTPATPTGHPLQPSVRESGIVTGAGEHSLTDSDQQWGRDTHSGGWVEATHQRAATSATITSNNGTTLAVDRWSNGEPHAGDPYQILESSWLPFLLILPATIAGAERLWRQHSGSKFRGMLSGDGWKFDPSRQTYISQSGGALDPHDLKRQSLVFATAVGDDMREMAADMARGDIQIQAWESWMARTIDELSVAQAAIGTGGFDRLSPEIIAGIEGVPAEPPGTRFSLERLQAFAEDVENGAPRNATVEAIQNRAGTYSDASNSIYEDARRQSHIVEKFLFEKNLLGPTEEHCMPGKWTDGCFELTMLGWVPIGTIPLTGLRSCGPACLCSIVYK